MIRSFSVGKSLAAEKHRVGTAVSRGSAARGWQRADAPAAGCGGREDSQRRGPAQLQTSEHDAGVWSLGRDAGSALACSHHSSSEMEAATEQGPRLESRQALTRRLQVAVLLCDGTGLGLALAEQVAHLRFASGDRVLANGGGAAAKQREPLCLLAVRVANAQGAAGAFARGGRGWRRFHLLSRWGLRRPGVWRGVACPARANAKRHAARALAFVARAGIAQGVALHAVLPKAMRV